MSDTILCDCGNVKYHPGYARCEAHAALRTENAALKVRLESAEAVCEATSDFLGEAMFGEDPAKEFNELHVTWKAWRSAKEGKNV